MQNITKRSFIFHIDMDSFFPSIEQNKKDTYKDKPLIVGGRNKNGVVSSANYEARKYGIKAAMPVYLAKKMCPNLIIADHNMDEYVLYSNNIYNFLKKNISQKIEIGSIDEWFVDISESKIISWPNLEIVSFIKTNIKEKFGLNCSIGVSYNKFLAKMATNLSKPNGHLEINQQNFKKIIWPLEIDKMIFVGKKTIPILKAKKIYTIKDLAFYKDDNEMNNLLGNINWNKYKNNALGINNEKMKINNLSKSIGKSHSSENYYNHHQIKSLCYLISKNLNKSIIEEKILYKTIIISIKNKEKNIKTFSISFSKFKDNINPELIFDFFLKKIESNKINNIKTFGIQITNLIENYLLYDQVDIFNYENKKNNILEIVNTINQKFKKRILFTAKQKY